MEQGRSICVFCGSSEGARPVYVRIAEQTGAVLARLGVRLVYGGGRAGLMGRVADAVLAAGGTVTGIIPKGMVDREIAHEGLSELIVTDGMTDRKAEMASRSDAFLVLPGGFGTMEEFSEVLSWAQIELHAKPIGFLNVDDFYTPLFRFFDDMVREGFLKNRSRRLAIEATDPEPLITRLLSGDWHQPQAEA